MTRDEKSVHPFELLYFLSWYLFILNSLVIKTESSYRW